MSWSNPPKSNSKTNGGEPPSLGAFIRALLLLAVLVVVFLIWVNTSG